MESTKVKLMETENEIGGYQTISNEKIGEFLIIGYKIQLEFKRPIMWHGDYSYYSVYLKTAESKL